jgi:NAD(P)-dependent dehydrogenase (short-subunit alcohol dehydrogenase family)
MAGHVLSGRTVLITGGAHGLGLAMLKALADEGANLVVADVDEVSIGQLKADVLPCHAERADISNLGDVSRVIDRCIAEFGGLDVVINNAGITQWSLRPDIATNPPRFWQLSGDDVTRFYSVNTLGPFLVTRAALPHLRVSDAGRIITVTTSHLTMIDAGMAPYGPLKAATEAFASVMARELADTSITVNVLIPGGATFTHMERVRPGSPPLLDAAIIGPPVVWLASRASTGSTGRRIIAADWRTDSSAERNLRLASEPIAWPTQPHHVG